jgi:hypothetical protein
VLPEWNPRVSHHYKGNQTRNGAGQRGVTSFKQCWQLVLLGSQLEILEGITFCLQPSEKDWNEWIIKI